MELLSIDAVGLKQLRESAASSRIIVGGRGSCALCGVAGWGC